MHCNSSFYGAGPFAKLILSFGFARQYTSERSQSFINARVFVNTRRKCAVCAYKRTVVFKWAAI